jgi:threonine dehydratase
MATSPARSAVTAGDVQRARGAIADVAKRTPVLPSVTLTQQVGADVTLKAESLQRTGSFKIRGALNKLAALGADCARGVTAGSAGNHAWALAQAARARGVPCEVFMPTEAPLSKAEGCSALGATVHRGGTSVEDCLAAARERAREAGIRSTTSTWWPGRAPSASSCSTRSPMWPRSSSRWAGAGWPAAWRSP